MRMPLQIIRASSGKATEIAAKISSAPLWMPKQPLPGDKIEGWADFRKKGMYSGAKYSFKKGWGGDVVRTLPAYDRVFIRPAYWFWQWRRGEA